MDWFSDFECYTDITSAACFNRSNWNDKNFVMSQKTPFHCYIIDVYDNFLTTKIYAYNTMLNLS